MFRSCDYSLNQVSVRASGQDFYRNRDNNGGVILNRRNNANLPNGKYKCYIPGTDGRQLVEMVAGIYSNLGQSSLPPRLSLLISGHTTSNVYHVASWIVKLCTLSICGLSLLL